MIVVIPEALCALGPFDNTQGRPEPSRMGERLSGIQLELCFGSRLSDAFGRDDTAKISLSITR